MQSQAGTGGAFSVTGAEFGDDITATCATAALTVSVSITDRVLGAGSCSFSGSPTWHFDEYDIYSTLPCTITMGSSAFAPTLSLRDNNNNQLSNVFSSGIGVGAQAQTTLSACNASTGGPLRIFATSTNAGLGGAYTLSVQMQGQASAISIHGPPAQGMEARSGCAGGARTAHSIRWPSGAGFPLALKRARRSSQRFFVTTVTSRVAFVLPAATLIVAFPSFTAINSPGPANRTTDAFDVVHTICGVVT